MEDGGIQGVLCKFYRFGPFKGVCGGISAVFGVSEGSTARGLTFSVVFGSFVRDAVEKLARFGRFSVEYWRFWQISGFFGQFSAVSRGILAVLAFPEEIIDCPLAFSLTFWSFLH